MNEFIFFSHTLLVVAFVLLALRLGKNGLIALIAIQAVLANLFVVKQMTLFGFNVTCSDVFSIGSIFALNLLQEYYGRDVAQSAVKISLFTLLFFALMSQVHLFYAPALFDQTQNAFKAIFSATPRIVFASISVFYIVQRLDVRLFGFLKGKFPVRVAISLCFTQLLDTVLFSYLGLYGLVDSLFDIILISFLVKCIIIATSTPFVVFSKRFVRHEIPL